MPLLVFICLTAILSVRFPALGITTVAFGYGYGIASGVPQTTLIVAALSCFCMLLIRGYIAIRATDAPLALEINIVDVAFFAFSLWYIIATLLSSAIDEAIGSVTRALVQGWFVYLYCRMVAAFGDMESRSAEIIFGFIILGFPLFFLLLLGGVEISGRLTMEGGSIVGISSLFPIGFMAGFALLFSQGRFYYLFVLVGVLICALSVYLALLSGTRGSLVAIASGVVAYAYLSEVSAKRMIALLMFAALSLSAFLISVSIIFDLSLGSSRALYLLESSGLQSTSVRLEILREGLVMFLESPLYGHGSGFFRISSEIHQYPHNLFLQVAIETGLIGVVLLILVIFATMFAKSRTGNQLSGPYSCGVLSILVASFVHSQFSFQFGDNKLIFMIGIIAAALSAERRSARCSVRASGGSG